MNDPNTIRSVGLDVHKETIALAVADGALPATILATIPHDLATLLKTLRRLGPPESIVCCYEAGPTGYGLHRQLNNAGYLCHVVAPSLVPVQSGCRIKTDRRDAAKLAHYLRSGDLTFIDVPDQRTEAIRDLERTRDDAKIAERMARHHLSKFLLRHGRISPTKTSWNPAHMAWIAQQVFAQPAQQQVLADYRETVELAGARVARLTALMATACESWEQRPLVNAFQALRGIDIISAVTLVAEIGDFRRFATAGDLMAFVGVVPSEHSSGGSRRQGRITRTGNTHVRRIVVEAAWHDRRQPRMSKAIRLRNDLVSPGVRAIAWKAQKRLHERLMRLLGRNKPPCQAVVAVARELVGFLWAISREDVLVA
ncbi:MAG: IS110 family transposase [Isosphaeraceae bacterium]